LPWTEELTFMQQAVLIASVRGPDGIRKDHPVKVLCRWLRRSFMKSAFLHIEMPDPYTSDGGSFMGPCKSEEVRDLDHAVELYLRTIDELPHHFQLHLMHAAEILGYKHPNEFTRNWWHQFYLSIVNDAHLFPESEEQMDTRLGDSEKGWRAREVVTAK
jgi:AraC-like DNA-binding protein